VLESMGGIAYISSLMDGIPKVSNAEHYARIVKEKGALRNIIRSMDAVQQRAFGGEDGADAILADADARIRMLREISPAATSTLGSSSTADLFSAQEKDVRWLCWPWAAVGLGSILDALPKLGKTVLFLRGIRASRESQLFLNFATKPMRVIYISEQSRASLAMQVREAGFTGDEPVEELRWITREEWSRFIFTDFLKHLEEQFLRSGNYNCLVYDTWHTIARLEDERDASEVNRLGNLTIDVATRNNLALALGRHDRKSGGEIGISGRSSIQLSGLVDVILHLVRVPGRPTQRKLELLGRVPSLPNAQIIDLQDGIYVNLGEPGARDQSEADTLDALLGAEPTIGYRTIAARTGINRSRVREVAESAGWSQGEDGQWRKGVS